MVKTKRKQKKTKQRKAATPFADAGAITGAALGKMFNLPLLKGVGKWLGSGIGTIFGSGDYTIQGPEPKYNVLVDPGQVPQFAGKGKGNVICHREFIANIEPTTDFTNRVYPINPGSAKTFPWLHAVAAHYQEYKIHGMIFEFKSYITDYVTGGSPGFVVMATNYNVREQPYRTKMEMENSEFANSVKPTLNQIHMIECDPSQSPLSKLYVAFDTEDVDPFSHFANFQLATQGNPAVTVLGELWVSYCIELLKPKLSPDIGSVVKACFILRSDVNAGTNALGAIQNSFQGDLDCYIANNFVNIRGAVPGEMYYITVEWYGPVGAVLVAPAVTYVNCSRFAPSGADYIVNVPPNGTTTVNAMFASYVRADVNLVGDLIQLQFGLAGTLPTGGLSTTCKVFVTQASSAL
jgi:hypothetical protein